MIIIICGFMGAGKTTLMNSLISDKSAIGIDLDEEIPRRITGLGDTVSEIILSRGIKAFREVELFCLEEILHEQEGVRKDVIISLGGGSLHSRSVDLISSFNNSLLIWVKPPFETCLERIKREEHRPLASISEDTLRLLYREREPFYELAKIHLQDERDEISIESLKLIAAGLGPSHS